MSVYFSSSNVQQPGKGTELDFNQELEFCQEENQVKVYTRE